MTGALEPLEFIVLVVAALIAIAMLVWFLYTLSQRDRISRLRRIRIGVFMERDLLNPDDLPAPPEPWPEPPDDAIAHDAPTDEWPDRPR